MNKTKITLIFSLIACILLAGILVNQELNYQRILKEKENERLYLLSQMVNATRTEYEYCENATKEQRASADLSSEITLADENHFIGENKDQYQSLLDAADLQTCKMVIMHASEKPNEDVYLPNPAYTYRKTVEGFAPREVLLLPEYNGNLNWTDTLHWIQTDFAGIPICLPAFEGGNLSLPEPNLKLTLPQIQQAKSVADVRMIRIAEMISWYMEYSNPELIRDEVVGILDFCKNNGLKVLWSEWKISDDVWPLFSRIIKGYEDIVIFAFQTNDEYDEPLIGYLHASEFQHWGASVQSWYWVTHLKGNLTEMPDYVMEEHTLLARNMGAEIIQFEPYSYFFDNLGAKGSNANHVVCHLVGCPLVEQR